MKHRAVEHADARWRIDVANDQCFSLFDVDLDGRSTTVTAEAARRLRDQLTAALTAADRFATEEAARTAQAAH